MIAGRGRDVLLVASADLSHVGPRYGDPTAPTAAEKARLERSDRALLDTVLSLDAEAFTRRMQETEDRTRVCGYAPIHTLLSVLSLLGGGKGSLVRYEQGVMGDEGSVVSFASIALRATS
jgi:hypothetical protein